MKASRYNIFSPPTDSGDVVLFNSLYGSMMQWTKGELPIVHSLLHEPNAGERSGPEVYRALVDQKFLIHDNDDEMALIRDRKIAGIQDRNRLDVLLMPTMDCNFACPYCYEDHKSSSMAAEMVAGIKAWITKVLPNHKVVLFSWFGGEPLLQYENVLDISRHVVRTARSVGVSPILHMTTNGYLLSPARIQDLVAAELYDYQITMDGPPETHDRLRVLRNGAGTFARVFQNAVLLARAHDDIRVTLRVNFNHDNLHLVPQLLRMFPEDTRPKLSLEMEPIFGERCMSAMSNLPSDVISEQLALHCRQAEEMGFQVSHGFNHIHTGKLVYCYAERENQYVINYTGDVYKCSVCKFEPNERVGYIAPDGTFVRLEEQWRKYVNDELFEEHCLDCAYLPLCMGGCRSARLKGKSTGTYCSLVPSNASFLLKQVALGGFRKRLLRQMETGHDASGEQERGATCGETSRDVSYSGTPRT